MSVTDQDGNKIQDGDWIGFCINGLIRGNVAMVSEGGIALPNNQTSPAFINVVVQIPCGPGNRLPNVSKIFGPHQEVS
jgi:hypothetical protein